MKKVYIIAEAGVNHNGDLKLAHCLVDAAKAAGADAVKFQTFKAERLVSKTAQKAEYQKKTTSSGESQFDMIKRLELSPESFRSIADHCRDIGIEFLSTAFDEESIILLHSIGMSVWKVPSGEITNLPYLRAIASNNEPIIMSTGMCTLGEIEAAVDAIEAEGVARDLITLLHCTTEYPAPIPDVNLLAMVSIGNVFKMAYGYSDHTEGIVIPIAAVAMGATIIEKHFTLNRNLEGPDHKASLEPDELASMVHGIRAVETAMGDGVKRPTESEMLNRLAVRKSIVAASRIEKGEEYTVRNLTTKRPGTGISPMEWDRVIGKIASRSYSADDEITL